jgi:phosphoglycolate phosphatase
VTGPQTRSATLRLALLDLDGTLVDSVPDLWAAADAMLRLAGRGGISQQQVRRYVGNGVERLVHRCLTDDPDRDAPAREFEAALATFNRLYQACNGKHSRIFDGVKPALQALRAAGVGRACVTNKPRGFTLDLLRALRLDGCMDLVLGGDDVGAKKPAPEALLRACEALGVDPTQAVMFGDSSNDVLAARAAGITVMCVDYGYNHGRDIRESRPDAVAGRLDELVARALGSRPG